MSMMVWSDDYSVDIQEIDEQHKCLVELINKLYNALAAKGQRNEVASVLDQLVEYTKIHFAVEEALMRIFHYREYEEHKSIHDKIVVDVVGFQQRFHRGDDSVGMELLQYLKDWLVSHILHIDRGYTETFAKGGAKSKWLRKFW